MVKRKRKEFEFPSKPYEVFVIAEAGVNHNGEMKKALQLIEVAAKAGADAVKFQAFRPEQVVAEVGEMASYQKRNIGQEKSQREMLAELVFGEDWYPKVVEKCKEEGVMFMTTPHGGRQSVKLVKKYVKVWKVGSGDLLNFILLDEIAKTKKPVVLSSGMHNMREVRRAIKFMKDKGYASERMVMLHCTTNYPTEPDQVNMASMLTMIKKLDVTVGYSDHTQDHQAAIMAVTLGARVYECHYTLDKNLPGPDHKASAEPNELAERIRMIRQVGVMMGDPKKEPNDFELTEMRPMVTRSVVAVKDLEAGHVLSEKDLEAKRPGDGFSPSRYEELIGRKLKRDIPLDGQIGLKDVE